MSDADLMPDLTPYDRRWIAWEDRIPATRPEPAPFDRAVAIHAATDALEQPLWSRRFPMPRALSRPAARFWFAAATAASKDELARIDVDRPLELAEVVGRIVRARHDLFALPDLLLPLAELVDPAALLEVMIDERRAIDRMRGYPPGMALSALAAGYCDHVVPYLDAGAFAAGAARVRDVTRGVGAARETIHLHHLAAAFLLSDVVRPIVEQFQTGGFNGWNLIEEHHLVYALGSPELVARELKRVGVPFQAPQDVREWFAITRRAGIAHAFRPESRAYAVGAEWVEALGTVRCVETAAAMLALTTRKHVAEAANAWLDRHPALAVPAAVASAEAGKRRDAAVATLKRAAALGHTALIQQSAGPALLAIVLGAPDGATDMAWFDVPPARTAMPLRWLYADALPPLVVDGCELTEPQVLRVIEVLRASTLVAPDARSAALRAHADAQSTERFALALFHQWLRAGAAAQDKWALYAVGLFGRDEAAITLVPHIRRWPGESQHARAVIGLECLRAIGSDVALTQIAGLAQKLSFAALKRRANECLEEIARERQLTRDRLEDRIVPALDLVNGARAFVLHGAVYSAASDDQLAPVLHDPTGKLVRDLPKRAPDESDSDAATRAEWKLFKKQLRDVAQIERTRLEAAMVAQRSWFADEFATLLAAHPIVGRLVRRLLWCAESADGAATLFRVAGDGAALGVDDAPVAFPVAATIRLAHRLELDEAVLEAWETCFAALRIEQPFPQLDRVTYRLDDLELADDAIRRFDAAPVPEPVLLGRLRTRGWQRAQPEDGGAYTFHWKRFDKAGFVALLQHDMVMIGYAQPDSRVALRGCTFVRAAADAHPFTHRALALRDVPAVPISEVCADCAFVLS